MTGTSGSVTYRDKGCGSVGGGGNATDRINVQIVGATEQRSAELTVGALTTQGIQFVTVDNPTICQKGTGCPSVANVVFKTVDQTGAAQQGAGGFQPGQHCGDIGPDPWRDGGRWHGVCGCRRPKYAVTRACDGQGTWHCFADSIQ